MKPRNLISVLHGATALESLGFDIDKQFKLLKTHEIRTLGSFCDIMQAQGCTMAHFDGFFVGYSIEQIGKEFDLLRFGTNYTLNIEIKSELKVANKEQKIYEQMKKNHYYLKFLGGLIRIFTYAENDGFYEYNIANDCIVKVDPSVVANSMLSHCIDYTVEPNKKFVPSNYLVSPFNSTDKFITNEYFLTSAQQKIKDEIQNELIEHPFMFFCISANAGTGKTLLMYDIAKQQISLGKKVLVIHCGKLNNGHYKLRDLYNWDIRPIREIPSDASYFALEEFDYIFVDEAQRIRISQLNALVKKASELKTPMIFSFDTKQYLRAHETTDIGEYISNEYPTILTSTKKLTNKIRTNKNLASFITNLISIGKSKNDLNYECVTIEYMNSIVETQNYINFLQCQGWTPITYTTSRLYTDPYDNLVGVSAQNAHDVIGQEFSKVVFVMDENFQYGEDGKLTARQSYYSAKGMLYQIVTRVVDELKIIVLDNPELYIKLLEIKAMGE